jgi:hypothetical protein
MSNYSRADHYRAELKRGKYYVTDLLLWLLDEFEQNKTTLSAKEKEIHRLKVQLKRPQRKE